MVISDYGWQHFFTLSDHLLIKTSAKEEAWLLPSARSINADDIQYNVGGVNKHECFFKPLG
jgi:hypothetical protein